jgi:RNA-splicing ligase RtcB
MANETYNVYSTDKGVPVKAWTKGVPVEEQARQQLLNAAQMPFVFPWIAAMPDVHFGIGATVGQRDSDAGRDYSCCGGSGYRLRDDGGADQPDG